MFVKVASVGEVAPGKLKGVEANGQEIVLANFGGKIYALQSRCGHMNAPLHEGTLGGNVLICPLHFAKFDVTTGKCVGAPVMRRPDAAKDLPIPDEMKQSLQRTATIMSKVRTHDLKTFEVKIEGNDVLVGA